MRITSKGQVTIPKHFRQKLGFIPGVEVEFYADGNTLKIVKKNLSNSQGRNLVKQIRGKATRKITTDQIMELTRGE